MNTHLDSLISKENVDEVWKSLKAKREFTNNPRSFFPELNTMDLSGLQPEPVAPVKVSDNK